MGVNRLKSLTISKGFIEFIIIWGLLSLCISMTYALNIAKHEDKIEIGTTVIKSNDNQKSVNKSKSEAKKEKIKKNITPRPKTIEEKIIANPSTKGLSEEVLHYAVTAYKNAKEEESIPNHKLTIIDYSMPSDKKRMWVVNMDNYKVELNTYVSHGLRSGDKNPTQFSNQVSSYKSSIGVMKTGTIYQGKRGTSLHLHGLEKNINSNVYNRHIVIHGSNYVSEQFAKARGRVGRSLGCPAVDFKVAKKLINNIANGSVVFAYYPIKSWLNNSEYL